MVNYKNKTRLRILAVAYGFDIMGGAVTRTIGLFKGLYKYDIDATILSTSLSEEVYASLKLANLKIFIGKIKRLSDFLKKTPAGFDILHIISMALTCLKYLKRNECELIYVRPHPEELLACLFLSMYKKKPLIIELHSPMESLERFPFLRIYIRKITNLLIGRASKIVVNSWTFRKELMLKCGAKIENKICVVPNGVNVEFFCNDRPQNHLSMSSKPIIGFIGSLKPVEDLFCLTKAAKLVLEKYPNTLFLMVGEDMGSLGALEQEIERLGLKDSFSLLGKKPHQEVPEILKSLSVFVAPRVNNIETRFAMPIKIIEAMAMGVPVVTTSLPAIEELVGDAAILVLPYDHVSFARGLIMLLEDQKARYEFVRKARERAMKFNWENIERDFAKLLTEVYSNHIR